MLRVWVRFRAADNSLEVTVLIGSATVLHRIVCLIDAQPMELKASE
jgi:hypothetical protein